MILVIVVATPMGSVAAAAGELGDAGIVVLGVAGAPTSGTGGDHHGTASGSSAIGVSNVPPTTGAIRHQVGMLHHIRKNNGGSCRSAKITPERTAHG
jgi:hypothetical protein